MKRWPKRRRAAYSDNALSVRERFEAKYTRIDDADSCWLWTASTWGNGYGHMVAWGRVRSAHRISYKLYVGDIPDGMNVLHRCDVPPCVRPSHLFLGTLSDNTQDSIQKGRVRYYMPTHCRQGHEYNDANTRLDKHGHRVCRICASRAGRAASKERSRAAYHTPNAPLTCEQNPPSESGQE